MADAKVTALTEVSVPSLEDLLYLVDDPAGTPASAKASMTRALGLVGMAPGGRLTLTTAVPITNADVTAASTLYYTPYLNNVIRIFDGTRWKVYTYTERSLALSGLTSGKNYDVFIYDNAGTLTLELSAAWTNDTTRTDALALQDGVYVKDGTPSRLWLGTIRTTGTTTTEDSVTKRFVWNAYNRAKRSLYKTDSTVTWTYSTGSWRQANNAAANQVEIVSGQPWSLLRLTCSASMKSSAGTSQPKAGIGESSTTVLVAGTIISYMDGPTNTYGWTQCLMSKIPALGYYYYAWLEYGMGTGTQTWIGQTGVYSHGLQGEWEA